MALDAGAVVAHLKLDTKEFKKATGEVKSGAKTMGDSAKGAGGAFGGLWKQIAVGVGVTTLITRGIGAIKNVISDTMRVGREFERAWANTTTMMTTSADETKKMKDELLKLSPTLGDSTDLAKGLYQVLSASIPAGEAVKFLGESAKSAQAGVTDTTTAVDALTTVINAYGLKAGEVTSVSDIMFQTVKRGKLTYEEMAGSLGTVVPIASQVGLGFDQIGAAMATLTRQGIDANTATVQLRQIMVSVLNPSREAEKAAKALGLEFNAQALATKGLSGFLADVKEKTHGNVETMSQLFGNVRALTGVMGLAGESAQGFKDDLELMRNAAGSTEEAFRKQMDSLDFWLKTAKNTFGKLKIAFYEGFAGPIKDGIKSSEQLELQVRLLQARFEDFGRSVGKTFKFVIDNASIFWASLKGPQAWAKEMAERASGIKAMKTEILEARVEAEDWAASLKNLNISEEELAKNYGRNTEEGAKWRAKMEELNRSLETQKDDLSNLNGVMIAGARYMKDQVNAIIETSATSEEASRRIRELRDYMKSGAEASKDEAEGLGEVDKAAEKYKETLDNLLESLGISKEKEKELYDVSKMLDGLYKEGKISVDKYKDAHKELVDKMFDYGETLKTTLPKNREFKNLIDDAKSSVDDLTYGIVTDEDQIKFWSARLGVATNVFMAFTYEVRKFALFLQTGILLPDLDFGVYTKGATEATKDISTRFDGLYNDIAQGFGDSFSTLASEIGNNLDFLHGEFFDHAINFKAIFEELWGNVRESFFRMIGEMTSDAVLGLFKNLLSSIGKSATETMAGQAQNAVKAIGGITQGASSAIGGMWTALGSAVGSFLGTTLAGLIGGGPSGHAQKQAINDTKDSRNFLAEIRNWLASVGMNIEKHIVGLHNERHDQIAGRLDIIANVVDNARVKITDRLNVINQTLKNVTSAAEGAYLTKPELVMTHGRPSRPEVIAPLQNILRLSGATRETKTSQVNVNVSVNLDGTIVSDREFTRSRLLPEIISALDAPEFKGKIQQKLGVA